MRLFDIKRFAWWSLSAVFAIGLVLPAWAQSAEMSHGQSIHHDTSPPLSEMAGNLPAAAASGNREINPISVRPGFAPDPNNSSPDGGMQSPSWQLGPTPGPILSVSGLSEQDNVDTVGTAIVPPTSTATSALTMPATAFTSSTSTWSGVFLTSPVI